MAERRPGIPRRAGRPVAPSGARGGGKRAGTGSRRAPRSPGTERSGAARRPRDAARPRRTPAPRGDGPATTAQGPVRGITRRGLALIAIVVVALATLVPTLNRYVSQRQQLATAQEQVEQQRSDVDALQAQVDRWDDPTFVAAQARERLVFAFPGETQYRLTDTSGEDVPLTEDQKRAEEARKEVWYDALWTSVEGSSRLDAREVGQDPASPQQPQDDGQQEGGR